jgi:hypothetical protein
MSPSNAPLVVNVEALSQSSRTLAELATRLGDVLTGELTALGPAAAGREEVSARVARWLRASSESMAAQFTQAIVELDGASAALRAQAEAYAREDDTFRSALSISN